ncbi:EAL domain-containing protein [Phorcysia thermohydrogeniphila]|uniref:PAS domain S-box-containing protein n=1 Tax=Phorcysia thermohydrogeniphila TaxID=936138 RepID=A0A4R1GET0_9BACT|nr:EAL domain-containing protein [Phorcysia thermohydrogeniphila]TCK05341.1 PAS domain S-box-containing protein [Phorcysia thermohydrogeniphila]
MELWKKLSMLYFRFWNKFSIRARILMLISLVIFPMVLMTGKSVYSGISKYIKKDKELRCIEHIKHHIYIVSLLQKHRGLLSIYLNGDKRVKERVLDLEREIKEQFKECLRRCKEPEKKKDLEKMYLQFKSLLLSSFLEKGFSAKEIFDRHTLLISRLLEFAKDEAIKDGLLVDSEPYIRTLADVALIELPQLTEIIGRVRGLGSGILAKKKLEEEEKEDIVELYRLLSGYRSVVGWTVNNIQLPQGIHVEFHDVLAKVDNYLDFVELSFIIKFNSTLDPISFFDRSSEIIDRVYSLYDSLTDYLQSFLKERKKVYLGSFTVEALALILFSSFLTCTAVTIYRTIGLSLNEILRVADGISRGDFDVKVEISDRNEFGRVARALNTALERLKETVTLLKNYKLAVDESNVILKTDSQGIITYANKEFEKLSGYKASEVTGKHLSFVFETFTDKDTFHDVLKAVKEGKLWKGRLVGKGKADKKCVVDTTIVPISKEGKKIIEFVVICHDVTELEESRQRLYHLLNYDTVTGLPNRNKLLEDIYKAEYPAICVLDISDFNHLNELFGEEQGDAILEQVGKELKKFSKNVLPYRVQSDEFALLYDLGKKSLTKEEFLAFCREIINALENAAFRCGDVDVFLNFKAGFAATKENKKNLLAYAEMALNEARRRRVKIFEMSFGRHSFDYLKNMLWIKKVRGALEDHRIIPFYQPIYNNATGKVEKFEALVRMVDEDGHFVSPGMFLSVAKKAGIYPDLTREMFRRVLEDFENLPFDVSVNISFEDLLSEKTVNFILDALKRFPSPDRLTFEILETEEIENYSLLHDFVSEIKTFGCKFAIDDFGTGYSNFENLMKLRVDYLKIDGSIIKRLPEDRGARALTEAIVSFSKELGIKTVAEFVSSGEIFELVKEIGIDYSQGYYFGKPEPIDVVKRKFKKL